MDTVTAPNSGWKPDEVAAHLRAFEQLLADSPDLTAALMTPAIPTPQKRAVVGKLAARLEFSRIVQNFLFVLLDHNRIAQLSEIRESFEQQIDEQLGYLQVDIASAGPLDPREIEELQAELGRLSGKQILPHFSIDPALLGGVVARAGSIVYDGSLRGQLQQMRRDIAGQAGAAGVRSGGI